MKHVIIITIAVLLGWYNCTGQSSKNENGRNGKQSEPKTDIKVKRQYDEHGNLQSFDSSYYSYSGSDSLSAENEFSRIRKFFDSKSFGNDPFFKEFFGDKGGKFFSDPFSGHMNDSIFFHHFSNIDPGQFRFDNKKMEQMFNEMDSLSRRFFSNPYQKPEKQGKAPQIY